MNKLRFQHIFARVTVLLAVIFFSVSLLAQDVAGTSEARVSAEVLNLKIAEVEASTALDEQVAGTLIELYRRALTNLERARINQQKTEALANAGAAAPDELLKVLREIDQVGDEAKANVHEDESSLTLSELEQLLAEQKTRLASAEAQLADFRAQYANEIARPGQARERLAAARNERSASTAELSAETAIGEAAEVTEARRWHVESRVQRLDAEINMLDQELLTHQARFDLLAAQRDHAAAIADRAQSRARVLEVALNTKRSAEAEQALAAAEKASKDTEDQPALVRELANGNVDLGNRLAQRLIDVQSAAEQRDQSRQTAADVGQELTTLRSKLAIAGMNQAMGQLLIDHQRTLPNAPSLQNQIREREQLVANIGLEQLSLDEQRRQLRHTDEYIDTLTAGVPAESVASLRAGLEPGLTIRRELVQKLSQAGSQYLRTLGELDLSQRQLLETTRAFNEFLDRRLLWVRSSSPLSLSALGSIPGDLARLFSPTNWGVFARDLYRALRGEPIVVLLLAVTILLGFMRSRFLLQVQASAKYVGRIRQDRFRYSIQALFFTVLAAIPAALILIIAGSTLSVQHDSAAFSEAIATSLVMVGTHLLIIRFYIDACRQDGFATRHCGWSESTADKLAGELRWFQWIFPLSLLIGEASVLSDTGEPIGGLATFALVLTAASLGVLIIRLLTPEGGILRHQMAQRPNGLVARWRPFWMVVLSSVTPILVALWLAGFTYMGNMLAISFLYSIWLVFWLMLLQGLLARWLKLNYQRLELRAAIEKREAARTARRAARDTDADYHSMDTEQEVEEPEIDFAELNSDSRSLLNTVILFLTVFWLWLIWSPVIPALTLFEDVTLWTRAGQLNGESVTLPVTLVDLFIAFVLVIATGAASRGLPSFAELYMLQRTEMAAGERYTITTLLRYSVIGIGAILVVGKLGVDWSKIQWLVAALGVGIGFGLQEIVANFISGLIILFERPIRVGDTVTVGETSGVVTRIRIRATTVRDWDRRELLVPNREFISNRLLNWSLSDNVIRLVLPIGISYGSDVVLAMKLAEEVARDHEAVLDDPPPFVIFEGFGDNALQMTLRAFTGSIDDRITLTSALNVLLERKFKEAGITIAFPQRDVHLDTSRPLEIRLTPEAPVSP